jgi:hypothetical protein
VKSELEDLGLKYTDEDWFNTVTQKLAETEPSLANAISKAEMLYVILKKEEN